MTTDHACCAPGTGHDHSPASIVLGAPRLTKGDAATLRSALTAELVDIPGGEFVMGHDGPDGYASDGEGPAHVVALRPFRIDADGGDERAVRAVSSTRPATAPRRSVYGWSFVFAGLLPDDFPPTRGVGRDALVAPGRGCATGDTPKARTRTSSGGPTIPSSM